MLKRLLIENYALIDHLDITFPGGLVIVTGETGAGKSILLGALSLVLGGRSDVSVLKDPARNCVVEAKARLNFVIADKNTRFSANSVLVGSPKLPTVVPKDAQI